MLEIISKNFESCGLLKGGSPYSGGMLSKGWKEYLILRVKGVGSILLLENENTKDFGCWYFNSASVFFGNSVRDFTQKKKEDFSIFAFLILKYIFVSLIDRGNASQLFGPVKDNKRFAEDLNLLFLNVSSQGENRLVKNIPLNYREAQNWLISKPEINVDSKTYQLTHSLIINEFLVAYLFDNKLQENDFILVFQTNHEADVVGYFIFNENKFYLKSKSQDILRLLFHHLVDNKALLSSYLASSVVASSVIIRNQHIGHNLWNDMTGLDRISKNGLLYELDEIILFGGELLEPWGRVADLFGFAERGIKKHIKSNSDLISYICKNRMLAFKVADNFITKSLVERIKNGFFKDYPLVEKQRGDLTVVIGLRLENRTWLNQQEGILEICKYLASKVNRLVVIVDGHDVINQDGETIKSLSEIDVNNTVFAEKKIVEFLSSSFVGANVLIVDSVRNPLAQSISLIEGCDFFICPWGAGMAKYKWVCNKKGIVLTSKWNLDNRGDLGIYESKCTEDPVKDLYVDASYITDLPDDNSFYSKVAESANMSRCNFLVDLEGVYKKIDEMLLEDGVLI